MWVGGNGRGEGKAFVVALVKGNGVTMGKEDHPETVLESCRFAGNLEWFLEAPSSITLPQRNQAHGVVSGAC